jgi:hypothetical protein
MRIPGRRLRALTGWILVAAVVGLSLWPTDAIPAVGFSDKLGHALAYAMLASWWAGLLARSAWPRLALALLGLGGALELAQALVPGRHPGWDDLLADAAGIGAGWLLAAATGRAWVRTRSPPEWVPGSRRRTRD